MKTKHHLFFYLLCACLLTGLNAYAEKCCLCTSQGQGCVITDGDGNIWTTVSYKEHPPADYSSCTVLAFAVNNVPTNYSVINSSGVPAVLVRGTNTTPIASEGSFSWTNVTAQLTLNANQLAPLVAGGNNFLKVYENYSTGYGLEHVIQFSSSAVGSPDQLSYQVYAINSQTKERIFDVMTAASGSSFNPLPSTSGTLLIEFGERGGDADINFDGVVDVHDIDVLTSGISSGVSIPYYDFSGNGIVDSADLTNWLAIAALRNGLNYAVGDANLDGGVDELDLDILQSHFNMPTSAWSPFIVDGAWSWGDFNGDGFVNAADRSLWEINRTVITGLRISLAETGQIKLIWDSVAGESYFVVFSETVESLHWTPLPGFEHVEAPAGGGVLAINTAMTAPQRFYRVGRN